MAARRRRNQEAGEEVQGAEAAGGTREVVCPIGIVNLGGGRIVQAGERFELEAQEAADKIARGVFLDADEYDRRVEAARRDAAENPQGTDDE